MPQAHNDGTVCTDSHAAPCANIPGQPWFCVYTKPLRERAAEHRIREEGGTAWLPLEPPPKRAVERERVIRPLFPRYCFIQNYPWLVVRNAGGEELGQVLVSPLSRKPLPLPVGAVEFLMAQCGPNGVMRLPEPREVTRKDTVRVEDGPFAGFTGICQRTTRDRVWILLNLFGRQSEVPFTRKQVELA